MAPVDVNVEVGFIHEVFGANGPAAGVACGIEAWNKGEAFADGPLRGKIVGRGVGVGESNCVSRVAIFDEEDLDVGGGAGCGHLVW